MSEVSILYSSSQLPLRKRRVIALSTVAVSILYSSSQLPLNGPRPRHRGHHRQAVSILYSSSQLPLTTPFSRPSGADVSPLVRRSPPMAAVPGFTIFSFPLIIM